MNLKTLFWFAILTFTHVTQSRGADRFLWYPFPTSHNMTCGIGCYDGHVGMDYKTAYGEPIYAGMSGQVAAVVNSYGSGPNYCSTANPDFGNYVKIQNGPWMEIDAHLKSAVVQKDQNVVAGQLIGYAGNSGYTIGSEMTCPGSVTGTAYHLHREIRYNGTAINPDTYDGTGIWTSPLRFPATAPPISAATYNLFIAARASDKYANLLGNPKPGDNGKVHWYHQLNSPGYNDALVQEFYGANGGSAMLVYDINGKSDRIYLVHMGFLEAWTHEGGPRSDWGMPINDEYVQQTLPNGNKTARQDFQRAYMYYDGYNVTNDRYYPSVGPGWSYGWKEKMSYAFADAYDRNGKRNTVGEVIPNGTSPADVHKWDGVWVQDFNWGSYGKSMLVYNESHRRAYLIRTGFYGWYTSNSGVLKLGAPIDEERDHAGVQNFQKGTLRWKNNNVEVQYNTTSYISTSLNPPLTFPAADIGVYEYAPAREHVARSTGSVFKSTGRWIDGWKSSSEWHKFRHLVGDVNGDGLDDLVLYNPYNGWIDVALSDGKAFTPDPAFTIPSTLYRNGTYTIAACVYYPTLGDVDGDGRADLIFHNRNTGQWIVHRSTGSSFAQTGSVFASSWLTNKAIPWIYFTGDVNGDGKDDLIVYKDLVDSYGGGNNWFVALSTGTSFSPKSGLYLRWGTSSTSGRRKPFVGDVDGNGKTDIGVHDVLSGNWYVAKTDGAKFYPPTTSWKDNFGAATDYNRYQIMSGDVNGDGKDDVVLYKWDGGNWYVGVSTGAGFSAQTWMTNWASSSATGEARRFVPYIGNFTNQ
jgi:hypothetical protein